MNLRASQHFKLRLWFVVLAYPVEKILSFDVSLGLLFAAHRRSCKG